MEYSGNEIPYIKQPALVLNLIGNDKEDGFLTASEIFEMDLNADIEGLSACKTGLGVQSAGEGVVEGFRGPSCMQAQTQCL